MAEENVKVLSEMTENDFGLLKECISKVENGAITVSLKRLGLVNFLELNNATSTGVTNSLFMANGFIRLKVKFDINHKNSEENFDIKQFHGIYNQFVRENTNDVLNGKEESLCMELELAKIEEKNDLYYRIQLFNPVLCFMEGKDTLHFVFTSNSMNFGKLNVSYEDILGELEYEYSNR